MSVDTGKLWIISGPAGSGKTTLVDRLLAHSKNVERVITATTRAPRGNEKNGVDYHFLHLSGFKNQIQLGHFYEYAQVHGNYYGTPKAAVTTKLHAGIHLMLNIDVQGAASFRKAAAQDNFLTERLKTVFVMPPSLGELKKRLENRGDTAPETIEKRLAIALQEMEEAVHYDYCINSSDKESDFQKLLAICQGKKS